MTDETETAPVADERVAALERKLIDTTSAYTQRLVQAELKAEAIRTGMVDLDGIRLVDTTTLTVNDKGEVAGAAAVMEQMRTTKPWLFSPASSSAAASPPPAQMSHARLATEMTREEWQQARTTLLKKR